MPLALAYACTRDRQMGARFALAYWVDEIVLQFLVFAVVLSLIWSATSAVRCRRILRAGLIGCVVLATGVSFLVHFSATKALGAWMTPWGRDLDFFAAILDMLLWGILIANRQRDPNILMLSGGLGIMFAGDAIGESIRSLSSAAHSFAVLPSNMLMMLSNLALLYIWWQAFRVRDLRSVPARHPEVEIPHIEGQADGRA